MLVRGEDTFSNTLSFTFPHEFGEDQGNKTANVELRDKNDSMNSTNGQRNVSVSTRGDALRGYMAHDLR